MAISPPQTVIFTAPQGWGKTRNSEALRREFGCSRVVDALDDLDGPHKPLLPGVLYLTNLPPSRLKGVGARVVSLGW